MNAIYNASWLGVSLDGATMYVYGLPVCELCCPGILQSGIKRVVMCKVRNDDRWNESFKFTESLFKEGGLTWTFVSPGLICGDEPR